MYFSYEMEVADSLKMLCASPIPIIAAALLWFVCSLPRYSDRVIAKIGKAAAVVLLALFLMSVYNMIKCKTLEGKDYRVFTFTREVESLLEQKHYQQAELLLHQFNQQQSIKNIPVLANNPRDLYSQQK
ncbi:MAG: hypothetical protein CO186_10810 [Zetaproteobacteria bacterium CG_4_9_14_3_um_filter_49_83]|nr:MAG: hypothetical protein AUJ56_09200 [Zetaproteobacteria bacterium CG1_02_49_23]PIQ33340.1 MAG: hypothetical protein COW62_05725 [Zetaproteobacteria bacterium CG17_big_fil_post_rev_8_21_14_2_50_50_13]PIV31055.1 MAG: hypothetical protein COS35_03375 [Zetaproteobacteria bacterium CG02_land_8_20_14_3_00_50_9]PIY57076.1 MAG: hypothetical protein COZ00_00905 [Zetaproteobacteria bacterium CG_4_10_14_0_8_um_filter_49_80]PJA34384.1 MAG: hypothetical protein CO186_10810 [Zetaproteobacteria bacterium